MNINRVRGSRHPRSVLTETQVADIRRRHLDGVSVMRLKSDYDVNYKTIQNIVRGNSWQHVADAVPLRTSELTSHDWLQIEQAASGCISGTSDDWPEIRVAIKKITGKPFTLRKSAAWLQGFCEGILIQSGRSQ